MSRVWFSVGVRLGLFWRCLLVYWMPICLVPWIWMWGYMCPSMEYLIRQKELYNTKINKQLILAHLCLSLNGRPNSTMYMGDSSPVCLWRSFTFWNFIHLSLGAMDHVACFDPILSYPLFWWCRISTMILDRLDRNSGIYGKQWLQMTYNNRKMQWPLLIQYFSFLHGNEDNHLPLDL